MNRHSVLLFTLVSVAASVSWWLSEITAPEQAGPRETEQFPNAYAKELTVISYDMQGLPAYKLTTPLMRHYEKDDTTELEKPVMWQFNADKPPWQMHGERAIMTGDQDSLYMSGKVFIDREGKGAISPYHIVTRNLTVNTLSAFAQTEQPIQLTSSDNKITAIGMQGWLRDPVRIKLLNFVRGHYELH